MNKLLLTIDFINDIVHPEGKINGPSLMVQQHNVIEHANRAIDLARRDGSIIAHVRVGFNDHFHECGQHSPIFQHIKNKKALLLNTWATEFHTSLNVQKDDHVLTKRRISAYYNSGLESLLKKNHINHITLCGVSTNMAIESTVRELHDRDYCVTVLAKACAAENTTTHQHSLINIKKLCQVRE